jgi:superfamily II DNA or RNA helicase
VIAVTSKLMSTGVDAQTCKLVVLDQNIKSMTLFKQIIGRGTRLNEEHGKQFFTILISSVPRSCLQTKTLTVSPCRSTSLRVMTMWCRHHHRPRMMKAP